MSYRPFHSIFFRLLLALLCMRSTTAQAADTPFDRLITAMDRAKNQSIDLRSKDGEVSGFDSIRTPDGASHLRLDFIDVAQDTMLGEQRPAHNVGPEHITIGEILSGCLARRDLRSMHLAPDLGAGQFCRVGFRHASGLSFKAGQMRLDLSPDVLDFLSLNRSVGPLSQPERLAIVIHDPHGSRLGRFELVQALMRLLPGPKIAGSGAMFLVEGRSWDPSGVIPLAPWDTAIGKGPDAAPAIRECLYHYVIDCELATRLLRTSNDIPSYAIDDNGLLDATGEMPDVADLRRRIEDLRVTEKDRRTLADILTSLTIGDQLEPNQYESLIQMLEAAEQEAPGEAKSVLADLRTIAKIYKIADARSGAMVETVHQRMEEHPDLLPFIFVGNFHTDRLLKGLTAKQPKTQFVVLDVRGTFDTGDQVAERDFQASAHGKNRWVSRWTLGGAGRDKGSVAPNPKDKDAIAEGVKDVKRRLEVFASPRDEFANLARAGVRLADAKVPPPPPPPPFKNAFAFFEPDDGNGKGPHGVLYDVGTPLSEQTNSKARFAFIQTTIEEGFWMAPCEPGRKRVRLATDGSGLVAVWEGHRLYFFQFKQPADVLPVIEVGPGEQNDASLRLYRMTIRYRAGHLRAA